MEDQTTKREHPAAEYHRRRRAEVDEKAFQVARDLIVRRGIAAFSVEALAEASGVAKTTLYRRVAEDGKSGTAQDLAVLAVVSGGGDGAKGFEAVVDEILEAVDEALGYTNDDGGVVLPVDMGSIPYGEVALREALRRWTARRCG